ncbi:ferric reductase-like transmembrane component/FAD binding protein [Coprinopsis sp. MPI-PUGE-AT-0042]|nr:ferric reductase-like transmembrane component/FAD binding protein [Coprinopsis sp. MPI-PUGE-AT-0042]
MSHGKPPVVPPQFTVPQIAPVDWKWQDNFSIIWCSVLGLSLLISLPSLARAIRQGRAFRGLFGVSESWDGNQYHGVASGDSKRRGLPPAKSRKIEALLNKTASVLWWSLPGLEVNLGQIILIAGYAATIVVCMMMEGDLMKNSNRAGYLAIAQLPIVFLFATKNSVLSLFLGPGNGYEKLNWIHKWSGRLIFLMSLMHGSVWIKNHLETNTQILGVVKEESGVAAFGIICVVVLTSLRPLRRMFYEVFGIIHIVGMVAFVLALCYHTPKYLARWISPALAFYGLDLFMRMIRVRVKDATLVPVNKQMTLVNIPDCTDGWVAGQHIRVRVFSSGRVFETHPFSILSAPPALSCITSLPSGINLGIRVMGDWTKALNTYAADIAKVLQEQEEECDQEKADKSGSSKEKGSPVGREVPVQIMFDGPYGGCHVDLGRYETVLLFAGGAGATFTIGLLDDIVGRCVKLQRRGGEITKRIEFAWCVRSFGSIDWFAPALMDIAKVAAASDLSLHISVYVTCLCNPEAVPPIPNCDVTVVRPTIYSVLTDMVTAPADGMAQSEAETKVASGADDFEPSVRNRLPWVGLGGGLAVCASGPEGLTREAANAVARLQLVQSGLGPVGMHTEVFGL